MNKHTLAQLDLHFDTAFAAPDGIKKLRELILTLAMQGKLVAQDSIDQPASELLKEIEAEKIRLVKAGKIKAPKPLPPIKSDEVPYELPSGWEWVRLSDALDIRDGTHDTPKYVGEGYPLVTSKNIYTGELCFDDVKYISEEDHKKISERSKVDLGDILFAMIGSIGNPVIVESTREFSIKNMALFKFHIAATPNRNYLHYFLKRAQENMKLVSSGAVQSFVSLGFLRSYLMPFPPLLEQHRIVAKIDELMARCDALEKLRAEQEAKRLAVHAAAIKQLTDAENGAAWNFIQQHFGELYTVKGNVAELRKAILQLAVMGKLVPQDPSDQPASELLKEIEAEKMQLVKTGKIKPPKILDPIKPDEVPYELPMGWEWCNLQDIFAVITDGDHQAPPRANSGVPFLVIGNLNTGSVNLEDCRFVPDTYYQSLDWSKKPACGDLLYTVTGSYGIPIYVDVNDIFCVQRHVAILKSSISTPTPYIARILKSKLAFQFATSIATGIAQKTVPLTGLRVMPVALPPKTEQHRIVARIDQLMALCGTLDQQIVASTQKQTELLSAVMAQV